MNDASQAVTGMLGLWLMIQLGVLLALLLGGLYTLYCLSRAASGLDRLAGAVEQWVERENNGGQKSNQALAEAPSLSAVPQPSVPYVAISVDGPSLKPLQIDSNANNAREDNL